MVFHIRSLTSLNEREGYSCTTGGCSFRTLIFCFTATYRTASAKTIIEPLSWQRTQIAPDYCCLTFIIR